MGLTLHVQVIREGAVQGQLSFDSDVHRTIKIGRLPSAQLKIDDAKASRIHAVIEFAGSEASLIDMGSTVGTVVNGNKIHKVKLNHGDQVTIGDTQIVIGLGSLVTAQQAAPAPQAFQAPAMQPMGGFGPGAAPAPWGAPVAPGMAAPGMGMPMGAPGMAAPVGSGQPRFDPGEGPGAPVRRITKERLRAAAVESKPHPSLAPEESMSADNRVLELRYYWGEVLLGVYHYSKPKRITIGESKKTDIFLTSEGLPIEEFPIIRYVEPEYLLTFSNQMEGEIELGGQLQPLQSLLGSSTARKDGELEGSYQVAMPADARAVLHWGGATFALRFVAPPKPIPKSFWAGLDLQYLNVLLLSVVFHVAGVITLLVYPYDTESLKEDLFSEPDRFAKMVLEPPKESKSTQDLLKKIKETVEKKKEEQKKPEEDKTKVKLVIKETEKQVVRPKKTEAQKQAEVKQKFSKMFTGGGGGTGAGSILGGGGGGSLSGTLSNVIGTTGSGSATAGLAGLGIRGGALTGGGIGTSRGIAGIGTAGRLGGGGMAYGSGVGMGGRKDRGLAGFGTPVIMGALPREVIQKVINENKNQIRYCYEVELARNQDLAGKVAVKWIIAATGAVAKVQVTETTLKNANVENCIMSKIRTWKFPAPAGGGIVEVNYPFVLQASG